MRVKVRRMGASAGIVLPERIMAHLGAEVGQDLFISLENRRLILSRGKVHPRAGWAEAAKELAASGDDALVW